ncbi:MAG: hypothetical protein V1911_02705 [Candidatus Micrarchaeota archaeon]
MGANLRFRRAAKMESVQPARIRQQAPAKKGMISNFLENRAKARELAAGEKAEKARQEIKKTEREFEQKRVKGARGLRAKAVEAAQARTERARLIESEARKAQTDRARISAAQEAQKTAEQAAKRERAEKEAAQRKTANMRAEQLHKEAKLRTEIERARKEADRREISRLSNTRVEERRPAHEGRAAITRKSQAVYEEPKPMKKKKLVLGKAVRAAEPPSDDGRRRMAAVSEAEKSAALKELTKRKQQERRPLIQTGERAAPERKEKPATRAAETRAPMKKVQAQTAPARIEGAPAEERKPNVFKQAQERHREMKKSTEGMAPAPGAGFFERLLGRRKRAEERVKTEESSEKQAEKKAETPEQAERREQITPEFINEMKTTLSKKMVENGVGKWADDAINAVSDYAGKAKTREELKEYGTDLAETVVQMKKNEQVDGISGTLDGIHWHALKSKSYEELRCVTKAVRNLAEKKINPSWFAKYGLERTLKAVEGEQLITAVEKLYNIAVKGAENKFRDNTFLLMGVGSAAEYLKGGEFIRFLDISENMANKGWDPGWFGKEDIPRLARGGSINCRISTPELLSMSMKLYEKMIEKEINPTELMYNGIHPAIEKLNRGQFDISMKLSEELIENGINPNRFLSHMITTAARTVEKERFAVTAEELKEVLKGLKKNGYDTHVLMMEGIPATGQAMKGADFISGVKRMAKLDLELAREKINRYDFMNSAKAVAKEKKGAEYIEWMETIAEAEIKIKRAGVEEKGNFGFGYANIPGITRYMNKAQFIETVEMGLDMTKEGANSRKFTGSAVQMAAALGGEPFSPALKKLVEINKKLLKKGINDTRLMEAGVYVISNSAKGKYFMPAFEKLTEVYEQLEGSGINCYDFISFGVNNAGKSVGAEQLIPEIERLGSIAERIGNENQSLFLLLDNRYNPEGMENLVKTFRPNEIKAINAGEIVSFNDARCKEAFRLFEHPEMKRSRNRLVRFAQGLSLSPESAGRLLDFTAGKEFGKKQMHELPYLAQYISAYEALEGGAMELEGATLKETKAAAEKKVLDAGRKKYGENFEKKLNELARGGAIGNMLDVIRADSALVKNYEFHEFEREAELLKTATSLWMKSREELEKFKFEDLEKLKVPAEVAEKWKAPLRQEIIVKPEQVSVEELVKRVNESLLELPAERQAELKKEYDEVISAINENIDAQDKTQKLLRKIKKENPVAGKHLGWVAGKILLRSASEINAEVTDAVRFSEWLNAGERFGTCQSWSSEGNHNRALMSFIVDGTKKIVGVYEKETGQLLGRGVMHLTEVEGKWGIYLDDVYFTTNKHEKMINDYVRQKAESLGVELQEKPGRFRGKAPYTYANNAGGLVEQEMV